MPSRTVQPATEFRRARKREAKHVSAMMKLWHNTLWNAQDKVFYLLPSRWFNKWREYVECEEGRVAGTPSAGQEAEWPGPVACRELLEEDKEYLHNYAVPDRLRDKVVRPSAENGKDFFPVASQVSLFLQERYGGEGIRRYQVEVGCNGLRKFYPKLVHVTLQPPVDAHHLRQTRQNVLRLPQTSVLSGELHIQDAEGVRDRDFQVCAGTEQGRVAIVETGRTGQRRLCELHALLQGAARTASLLCFTK